MYTGFIMLGTQGQKNIPEEVVQALQEGLRERLVAVVLFGSQARGDREPESDWDFLVIAKGLSESPLERHLALKRLLPEACRARACLLARGPEEFEAHVPSLYLDVALDGKILYDPQGYAAEKLSFLRGLLDRLGLYRNRTSAGDVWRWRKEPPSPWRLAWGM